MLLMLLVPGRCLDILFVVVFREKKERFKTPALVHGDYIKKVLTLLLLFK